MMCTVAHRATSLPFAAAEMTALPTGQSTTLTNWWGHAVELTFRFLDPVVEAAALARAGLELTARLDRGPYPGVEHASQRSYLLVQRPDRGS